MKLSETNTGKFTRPATHRTKVLYVIVSSMMEPEQKIFMKLFPDYRIVAQQKNKGTGLR